jgi:hypothetical protein
VPRLETALFRSESELHAPEDGSAGGDIGALLLVLVQEVFDPHVDLVFLQEGIGESRFEGRHGRLGNKRSESEQGTEKSQDQDEPGLPIMTASQVMPIPVGRDFRLSSSM